MTATPGDSSPSGLLLPVLPPTATIREVIAEAIAPYSRTAPEGRFTIEGPTLRLPPSIILPFSMALHELCTNAAKYGALSNETGQVAIRVECDGQHPLPPPLYKLDGARRTAGC